MKGKLLAVVALVGFVLAIPSFTKVAADGTTIIRMATLAPKGTTWDMVFKAWGNSLKEKTGGAIRLQMYAGGAAGDERDVIRKMKLGQMDAAGLTSVGLGLIARPVLILQMPGMYDSYDQLQRVREKMAPEFGKTFEDEGYKLLGWGDAGMARMFSRRPILKPEDYKLVRPWVPRDDPALPTFMKIIGANGVALGIPEVFPALNTGMVDTVMASAIAAVALQWFTKLTHMSKDGPNTIVGATLLRKEMFAKLSPEHQKILETTGLDAHAKLVKLVQKEDRKAYETLKRQGVQEFDPLGTPEQKKAWDKVNAELITRLTGNLWTKDFYERVKAAAAASK